MQEKSEPLGNALRLSDLAELHNAILLKCRTDAAIDLDFGFTCVPSHVIRFWTLCQFHLGN